MTEEGAGDRVKQRQTIEEDIATDKIKHGCSFQVKKTKPMQKCFNPAFSSKNIDGDSCDSKKTSSPAT